MSIEQTTQLIQLILNAVLMLGACGVMLCAALMHQIMLENRSGAGKLVDRSARHRRFRQQRQTRRSIVWLSGACWIVGVSCGALVLRSIWQSNELIGLSLVLFAGGCGLFLVGTGFLVVSVMTTRDSTSNNSAESSELKRSHDRSGNKFNPKVVDFRIKGDAREAVRVGRRDRRRSN